MNTTFHVTLLNAAGAVLDSQQAVTLQHAEQIAQDITIEYDDRVEITEFVNGRGSRVVATYHAERFAEDSAPDCKVKPVTYHHHAGPLFMFVQEIGTDEYLNAGAAVNAENHDRDVRAMRIFATDKFAAVEREASRVYGWQPLVEFD